jgi:hypothetical protein
MLEELLVAGLSHTTKSPQEFIATLKDDTGEFKPEAADLVKKHLSDHLKKVVEEQSGRAVKSRMTQIEKPLKSVAEKFHIQWDGELEANLTKIVEKFDEQPVKEVFVPKVEDITEEMIAKHPNFTKAVNAKVVNTEKEWSEKYANLNKEFVTYKATNETKEVKKTVRQRAEEVLLANRAKLMEDATKRKLQLDVFVSGLSSNVNFKLDDNGEPYPVDGTGEQLMDGYVPMTFQDFVLKNSIFEQHAVNPNYNGAGAQTQQVGNKNVQTPKSMAELTQLTKNAKSDAEKEAYIKAYEQFIAASTK